MEQALNSKQYSVSEAFVETDTIAAVSTASGVGGIAVIRVSGPEAFIKVSEIWKGKNIAEMQSHTAHFGEIVYDKALIGSKSNTIDQVVLTIFRNPASFTGEDTVEIACHGSKYIQREILNLLIKHGVRMAGPGEFSQRAFFNGRIDLAQAEGIADLINASSRAAHNMSMAQVKGQFSKRLESLRAQLIKFASLLELELDFSEEEVEFADRTALRNLATEILNELNHLAESYATARVFKEGVPVVIAGEPNAGKSTLLNWLLQEDKAIVSDIPGTTRDLIEDTRDINGVTFRFIDTAGLRDTADTVEKIGIDRATDRIRNAQIVLWLIDPTTPLFPQLQLLKAYLPELYPSSMMSSSLPSSDPLSESTSDFSAPRVPESSAYHIILINKSDIDTALTSACKSNLINDLQHELFGELSGKSDGELSGELKSNKENELISELKSKVSDILHISARTGEGLDLLMTKLSEYAESKQTADADIMVTNARHYEAIIRGARAIERALKQIAINSSADFIAQDVRESLHHLATITGTIASPDLLTSIFSSFCIGK